MTPQETLIGTHKLIRKYKSEGIRCGCHYVWDIMSRIDPLLTERSVVSVAFAEASGASLGYFNRWGEDHSPEEILRALDRAIILVTRKVRK